MFRFRVDQSWHYWCSNAWLWPLPGVCRPHRDRHSWRRRGRPLCGDQRRRRAGLICRQGHRIATKLVGNPAAHRHHVAVVCVCDPGRHHQKNLTAAHGGKRSERSHPSLDEPRLHRFFSLFFFFVSRDGCVLSFLCSSVFHFPSIMWPLHESSRALYAYTHVCRVETTPLHIYCMMNFFLTLAGGEDSS